VGRGTVVDSLEEQLRQAVARGHDVQAHLHPHWLQTEVEADGGQGCHYRYDWSHFLLGNCAAEENGQLYQFCVQVFARARDHLTRLLRPVNPGYQCVAFRAGGYGVQPAAATIFAALQHTGFQIDSSVVPGMLLSSHVNHIDFRAVPAAGNYWVAPETGLHRPASSGVFEIPVAAGRVGCSLKLRQYLRRRLRPSSPARGYGAMQADRSRRGRIVGFLKQAPRRILDLLRGWAMLELCDDPELMLHLTRRYVKRHSLLDGDLYFSFSCHSKTTTPLQIAAMQAYHRALERHYGNRLRAVHFREACRLVRQRTAEPGIDSGGSPTGASRRAA
jgi:hypothetical protein